MSDPKGAPEEDEDEVDRGPKKRAPFVARATANFIGAPLVPKGLERECIHRFMTAGTLEVSSRSARLSFHKEATAAEIALGGISRGHMAKGLLHTKVYLRRDRVDQVVIDRRSRLVAIKASAKMDDKELESGWFGMHLRTFPDNLVATLREAFGDRVKEGSLRVDHTRLLVMLAFLVVLGLLAYLMSRSL